MSDDKSRGYDHEGHIKNIKVRYAHQLNLEDDVIRNYDDVDKNYKRLKRWHVFSKIEEKQLSQGLPHY